MVKVKICGLFRQSDIEAVNEEGPDYIGFVFAESRRRVTPEQALVLRKKLRPGIVPVGVFVNERIENIVALAKNGVIDMIQLHGCEDGAYIGRLKAETDRPVIKALSLELRVESGERGVESGERSMSSAADYLLLDGKTPGSGRCFNWNLITENGVSLNKPFFLAGGLCPENVSKAINALQPPTPLSQLPTPNSPLSTPNPQLSSLNSQLSTLYAVDVSSGVETDGVKDPLKIREFIKNVKTPIP